MPKRTTPARLKEVRVLDPELAKLKPEQVVERTPFILVQRQDPAWMLNTELPDRASANFLGWIRLCIGLKSSASQRRRGLWVHREDWVWTERALPTARAVMAEEAKPANKDPLKRPNAAYVVALAVFSASVHRMKMGELYRPDAPFPAGLVRGADSAVGLRLRPHGPGALAGLQWLVSAGALVTGLDADGSDVTLEVRECVLLVKRYWRTKRVGRQVWDAVEL